MRAVSCRSYVQILSRKCSRDWPIPNSDIVIPKGSKIFLAIGGIHHDGQYFKDPEVCHVTQHVIFVYLTQ